MNASLSWLSQWLLDYALLASSVLAVAIVLRSCLRNPARRVALAWGTWLGLIALALLTALPQWPRVALIPRGEGQLAEAHPAPHELVAVPLEPMPPVESAAWRSASEPVSATSGAAALDWGWQGALALAWLAAAALAAVWIVLGHVQTGRLIRASEAAPAWIEGELTTLVGRQRRSPEVRMTRQLSTAAAVGTRVPKILLPTDAASTSQKPIVRAALAHEWAHIRHGDLWLLALERWLAPLLAWQPLWWWLRRGVRHDMELLADAAAAGDEPVEYAEALLAWAKLAGAPPVGLAALSLWESPHTLSRRVTMLLDPKRSAASPARRGGQVLLACVALALIAALSLVTARPKSADAQEVQAAAAEEAAAKPAKEPALIAIACVILEADREALAAVLPVERRWQRDPETDVSIAPGNWEYLLKQLAARPGTSILSRPQVQTIDGQMGYINIGHLVPPVDENSNAPKADIPQLGLVIELTPRVTQRPHNAAQSVTLAVKLHQADLQHPPEGSGKIVKRNVATEAIVPVGQTVIISHRPQKAELRPLVLAAQVFLVQREEQAGHVEPPATAEPAELRRVSLQAIKKLLDEAQHAADKPGDYSEKELHALLDRLKALTQVESAAKTKRPEPPPDLQRLVTDLQHELLRRTREAQQERQRSAALEQQLALLRSQLDKLAAAAPVRTVVVYRLKNAAAADAAGALKEVLEDTRRLGGDGELETINVQADASNNSLIVTATARHREAIGEIVSRLDRSAPQRSELTAPGSPAVPSPAGGLSVDRQTQIELMKLDLQEADIGLQAAQKDMSRVQSLRERGVISQEEVAKHEFQLQSAEIKVMRAKILLQGMMRQLAPAAEPKPTSESSNPKPLPRSGR